ncbi:hypothetical protein PR003_g28344 [Phytophthora rubi]|uniref:SET domain-containing protein n=1 Tax=Phytophthora rubi TaxID=129364 RepID=A0A6A4BW85_9STRA|nr:hypothetical protein PR002_g24084 [Phytophthora rubi]KAE8982768.1 hypothetical protein PR001_g23630 [Phytophthora rubi]KAE9279040.1 hypothetical protein PR003_g28344 [Phytophthora rubi]
MPGSSTKRQRASPEASSCAKLVIKRRRTSSQPPDSTFSSQTFCDQDADREAVPHQGGDGPRTRSGRAILPCVVNEAVTIQVTLLAQFRLSPPSLSSSASQGSPSAASSQRTVTDPSPSGSPSRSPSGSPSASPSATSEATRTTPTMHGSPSRQGSQTTTTPPWSPPSPSVERRRGHGDVGTSPVTSPQASTVAPWSPQSPFNRLRRHRTVVVPLWFAEVFESDGYDSEALEIIGSPAPPRRASVTPSASSSPGFAVVGAPPPIDRMAGWRLEPWPSDVKQLVAIYNPRHWKFPGVSAGVRGGVGCGCERRCAASTCLNAENSRFCTEYNCTFGGACGNGLHESGALTIARNLRSGMRGLVATAPIAAGEVIGEYFGHLQLFGPPCRNGPTNEGYRMHLRTRTTGNKYVGLDAQNAGGKLRFMNHACNPSTRFHEVQTGQRLTVVAVTVRDV